MHRQKVLWAAAAVFALGVAFAAQPTSLRANGSQDAPRLDALWVPGTNALMAAQERDRVMPPPH